MGQRSKRKSKTMNLQEENAGINHMILYLAISGFFDMQEKKVQAIKEKIHMLIFTKIKDFCASKVKDIVKKETTTPQRMGENICKSYV